MNETPVHDQLMREVERSVPLRCEGMGTLKLVPGPTPECRLAVRWWPQTTASAAAIQALEELPKHESLARIIEVGLVDSAVFASMELPHGTLLTKALEVPLPPEAVFQMGADVAGALAALHAQAVVHGELSPEAIRLLPSGRALLWSFPLVLANRLTDRRTTSPVLRLLAETAPYLAPECAQGGPLSSAADVYALAAILCQAGGGGLPQGESALSVVHQVASGQWRPGIPLHFPERVRAVLSQMLHRDSPHRPSAQVVAHCLSTPFQPQTRKPVQSSQSGLPLRVKLPAGLLTAALCGAGVMWTSEEPTSPLSISPAVAAMPVGQPTAPLKVEEMKVEKAKVGKDEGMKRAKRAKRVTASRLARKGAVPPARRPTVLGNGLLERLYASVVGD